MKDMIYRDDAIALVIKAIHGTDNKEIQNYLMDGLRKQMWSLPSAEAEGSLKAIKRQIEEQWYLDAPSAEAVQVWIPCSERLPEDLEAVNVTWVNHNPPVYYQYTKDVPNADTAVYYRGVWYWWDSTICDVLGEYGEKCGAEQIDKDIEILAWMPLPKPYREESEVEK